ncbi:hypothetical protein FSP39_024630 [Pinctada imbricata]|uniref:VWFD domain-containing protein n=1 Tax=Pinctada imbricata TaxID=66713 RepID=A0AA88YGA1_PINIB|nr:hypothetical protein FSP39_024630 [Pinctada imbricata]
MMSFWLIILFIIIDTSEALDPCYNYIAINEDARSAAVEFDTTVVNATLCDQFLKEGWYRSIGPAGGEMPTSCPAVMHCSTAGPIWIDMPEADKPPANTTVTKTACASGTQAPCPVGQSSETGYTPGCGSYPTSNVTGTVVPGLRTRDQYEGRSNLYYEEVQFECLVFNPCKTKRYFISLSFLLESRFYSRNKERTGGRDLSSLPRFRKGPSWSPVVTVSQSAILTDGLVQGYRLLDKDAYNVKESESIEIGLELTVPLPCQKRSSATPSSLTDELLLSLCVLELLITVPIYQTDSTKTCNADGTSIDPDGLVFQNAKCGVYFTASDWSSRSFLNVTGKVDSLYNLESRTTAIRLNPTYFIQDSVWNYWTMPDIKVAVIDSDHLVTGKMCTSVNDPHIIPFEKLVTLPTGTDIVIQVGDVYIYSVVIKPSVLDYNTTVGLCGHFGFENVGEYILLNKTFTPNLKYFNKHYA